MNNSYRNIDGDIHKDRDTNTQTDRDTHIQIISRTEGYRLIVRGLLLITKGLRKFLEADERLEHELKEIDEGLSAIVDEIPKLFFASCKKSGGTYNK